VITRIRVLLIEDNRADALLVRDSLRRHGIEFEIRELRDAEEADAYIGSPGATPSEPLPDVIILDLNLPKGNGLELLEKFKTYSQWKDIPVIVATSSDSPIDRARAAKLGAARYFQKPLDLESFLLLGEVVRDVLREAWRTEAI
jgi:CheY-like chemotaxis protein